MRSVKSRVFRVERGNMESDGNLSVVADNSAKARHDEIMRALDDIHESMSSQEGASLQEGVSQQVIETCQRDLREAMKIKAELKEIHEAIASTKL